MTEYKTMRVPKDAWEAARAAKHDKETWGEFLQRCSDTRPAIREFIAADAMDEKSADVEQFADQLDRIESAAKEATNAAQSAERTMEQLK